MERLRSNVAIKPISGKKNNGRNMADNHVKIAIRDTHRRRSRLGMRSSLNPLDIKVPSAKKEPVHEKQNGQNYGFLEDSSRQVSKRLDLNVSDSDNSTGHLSVSSFPENQPELDVNITGIHFIKDSVKKPQLNIEKSRKYLPETNHQALKFDSKVWDRKSSTAQPRRSTFFKSSQISAESTDITSMFDGTARTPDRIRNIMKRRSRFSIIKTPSPPRMTLNKIHCSISTPELSKVSLSHDYKKRYSIVSNNNVKTSEDTLSCHDTHRGVTNDHLNSNHSSSNDADQLRFRLSNISLHSDNKANNLRSAKDSVLHNELICLKSEDNKKHNTENRNSVESTRKEIFDKIDFMNNKNETALSYDLNNSLERAYVQSHDIHEIKDKKNATITLSTNSESTLSEDTSNQSNNIKQSPTILCLKSTKASPDRSQSFINGDKPVNATYELNNSIDSFELPELDVNEKYNNSLDNTLVMDRQKKRLSILLEESPQTNCGKKPSLNEENRISMKNISDSHHDLPFQNSINKSLVNNKSISITNTLSKMCDLVSHLENMKDEHDLFVNQYQQFMQNQYRSFSLVISAINDQKKELVNLIGDKENIVNESVDYQLINKISTTTNKLMNSLSMPNDLLKTPDNVKQTASKSVYSQLKTDYNCLKTPKQSTVKQTKSCSNIFTPRSMSTCIQGQLENLFDL